MVHVPAAEESNLIFNVIESTVTFTSESKYVLRLTVVLPSLPSGTAQVWTPIERNSRCLIWEAALSCAVAPTNRYVLSLICVCISRALFWYKRVISGWPALLSLLCLTWFEPVLIFCLSSGVSVSNRTSIVRERWILLLLLPGQSQSCRCHWEWGHLPFSWHQPGPHGASRTGWVPFNPGLDCLLCLERWSLIHYWFELFSFGTGGFDCIL